LPIPDGFINALNHTKLTRFIDVQYPVIVDSVIKSDAHFVEDSLRKGDRVIGINNQPVQFFQQFDSLKKPLANQVIAINVLRGNDTLLVKAKLNDKSQVGFWQVFPDKLFGTVHKTYSFAESIPVGIGKCWTTLGKYITGLQQIVSGKVKASESVGSVISIGNAFSATWDWQHFWALTAIFSVILAFMNILPIPALDGGHALFCIYEIITGRKPTDKFMEYAQMVGMIILLALMAYALGLDIFRLFK
jgi:regulator of sigma E protease